MVYFSLSPNFPPEIIAIFTQDDLLNRKSVYNSCWAKKYLALLLTRYLTMGNKTWLYY